MPEAPNRGRIEISGQNERSALIMTSGIVGRAVPRHVKPCGSWTDHPRVFELRATTNTPAGLASRSRREILRAANVLSYPKGRSDDRAMVGCAPNTATAFTRPVERSTGAIVGETRMVSLKVQWKKHVVIELRVTAALIMAALALLL